MTYLPSKRRMPTKAVNGDFFMWLEGVTTAPTYWVLTGGGATVARDTAGNEDRQYCWNNTSALGFVMALTRVGNDVTVGQTWSDTGIRQHRPWRGRTMSMTARVKTSTADKVRIKIQSDGTGGTTATSSHHSGGGAYETLVVSYDVPADATYISFFCDIHTTNATAYFSNVQVNVGEPQEFVPGNVTTKWLMDDSEVANNRILNTTDTSNQTNTETDLDSIAITIPDGTIGVFGMLGIREDDAVGAYESVIMRGKIGSSYIMSGGAGSSSQYPLIQSGTQVLYNTMFVPLDASHIISRTNDVVDDLRMSIDAFAWLVWE